MGVTMTPPRPISPLRLILLLALLAPTLLGGPPSARIAIRATAAAYYAPPSTDGSDEPPQTFLLIDGGPAPGTARDGKLARIDFAEVAGPLTAALLRRGFREAPEGEAPLLHVVVEWGRTKPAIDMNLDVSVSRIQDVHRELPPSRRGALYANSDARSESLRNELKMEAAKLRLGAEQRSNTAWDNALLLGYADELYKLSQEPRASRPWVRHEQLMTDLTSERLYLIVRAYAFAAGDAEGAPQAQLIWINRLSIRDEGPDFPTQLDIMLPFAERYFGLSTGELIRATSLKDFETR